MTAIRQALGVVRVQNSTTAVYQCLHPNYANEPPRGGRHGEYKRQNVVRRPEAANTFCGHRRPTRRFPR